MELLHPQLVTLLFDHEGNLLRLEERAWSASAGELAGSTPPYKISTAPELGTLTLFGLALPFVYLTVRRGSISRQ